jgi:hypothetical protein
MRRMPFYSYATHDYTPMPLAFVRRNINSNGLHLPVGAFVLALLVRIRHP